VTSSGRIGRTVYSVGRILWRNHEPDPRHVRHRTAGGVCRPAGGDYDGGMATLKQKVAWGLWVGGCAFVVLSWFGIVSTTVGWCGFAIGLAGSALAWAFVPPN
jgi:hypothetical protein